MDPMTGRWAVDPTYEQLEAAIRTLNAGLLIRTVEGKILFANDRMLEWSGYAAEELVGQDILMLVPEELRASAAREMLAISSGDPRAVITVIKRKSGRTFPVVSAGHVLRDGDEILGVVAVLMDLGEIQTARRVGEAPPGGLAESLGRIAGELKTISLFAGTQSAPMVPHDHPDLAGLSARELEILAELLSGARAPAIAKRLFISPHTVRNHLKSMYRKLEVSGQAELIEKVRGLSSS